MSQEVLKDIINHLGFCGYELNNELSDNEDTILDNNMINRRFDISYNNYTIGFSINFIWESDEINLNFINSELTLSKVLLNDFNDKKLIYLQAIYLMPYVKDTFNIFLALLDSDAEIFERYISEVCNNK